MELARLDLNKLRTFQAVVEGGGISGGARRLELTRSAVSQSVAALERSLGLRLFNRVGRRMVLTAEGGALARRFRRVEGLLSETLDEITRAGREVRGRVRLGLFLGSSRARLADFLCAFTREHTQIRVKLLYGSQAELASMLIENQLDFAFSLQPSRERSSHMRSTRLYQQELVLVSAERQLSRPATLDEIRALDLVDYYQSSPLVHRWIRHHYGKRAPRVGVRVWAASAEMVHELVARGAGAGVLPRYLVEEQLDGGALQLIQGGRGELRDTVWLTEPANAYHNRGLERFRSAILEAFAS